MLVNFGAVFACLGTMLAQLEATLAHLGDMLAHLGPMWAHLGAMLVHLGAMLARLGAMLAHLFFLLLLYPISILYLFFPYALPLALAGVRGYPIGSRHFSESPFSILWSLYRHDIAITKRFVQS